MTGPTMSPELFALVAERFGALSDPARVQLLTLLRDGEMSVSELIQATGMGQANASKHLQVLLGQGFVTRRKEGLYAYYALADKAVFHSCDIMCVPMNAGLKSPRRVLGR